MRERKLTGPEFFCAEVSRTEAVLDELEAAFEEFRIGNRVRAQRIGPAQILIGIQGSFLDWDLDEASARYRQAGWSKVQWQRPTASPGSKLDETVVLFTFGTGSPVDEAAEHESKVLQSL